MIIMVRGTLRTHVIWDQGKAIFGIALDLKDPDDPKEYRTIQVRVVAAEDLVRKLNCLVQDQTRLTVLGEPREWDAPNRLNIFAKDLSFADPHTYFHGNTVSRR
jgi:hypothetical protein